MEDRQITCVECGKGFTFSVGEQKYFADRKFEDPKRCANCRQKNKDKKARAHAG